MTVLTHEQEQAVQSIDSHVLVSAGAGSGKTHVLVERYIEILQRRRETSLSNLIAVTYTTKAANEMRSRLKSRLRELLALSSEEAKQRWSDCLAEVDQARISTIHSLCESILRTYSIEAGVDPNFDILNELEKAELLEASLDQALHQAIVDQDETHTLMLSYPVAEIKSWVGQLVAARLEYEEARKCLAGLSDNHLFMHCQKLMAAAHRRAVSLVLMDSEWHRNVAYLQDNTLDKTGALSAHRQTVLDLAQIISTASQNNDLLADSIAGLHQLAQTKIGSAGGPGEKAKCLRQAIFCLRDIARRHVTDLPISVNDADWQAFPVLRGLIGLVDRTMAYFNAAKAKSMRLDFNDLIHLANKILSSPDSLARKTFNEKTHAILVDEFQDTNRLQTHIINLLCGPGTRLFLIGDDKQSIYKFQGADVSIFNEWRDRFSGSKPQPKFDVSSHLPITSSKLINLNRSFRSHQDIVAFVNAIFGQLLKHSDNAPSYKAKFQPLVAHRQGVAGGPHPIEIISIQSEDEKPGLVPKRAEAMAVATWIAESVAGGDHVIDKGQTTGRPISWGDFAVLVQRNKEFPPIEDALSQLQIPYVTMAASGFLRRQEIYDLESVLRFLWRPTDSQSLLAALRSPMFAVSDDIIHLIAAGKHAMLWDTIQDAAATSQIDCFELKRVVNILTRLRSLVECRPVSGIVRSIIMETNFDIALSTTTSGRQRCRNVWKLASMASEYDHLSIGDFVSLLEKMRTLGVKQSNAPLYADDSVKLMTIHGAKGLEFPAVILLGLGSAIKVRPTHLLFHQSYGLSFDPTRGQGEKPSLFLLCRYLEKDMEEAERKRLLYVAMTRARDKLALVIENGGRQHTSFKYWLKEALSTCSDEPPLEPGIHHIKVQDRLVSYLVRNMDANYDQLPASKQLPDLQASAHGNEIDWQLINPIPAMPIQRAAQWEKVLPVTLASHDSIVEPTILGQYFHTIMQSLSVPINRPSDARLKELIINNNDLIVHPEKIRRLIEEGNHLLDLFWQSQLYGLINEANQLLHELPYTLCTNGEPKTKRPDLLLQDKDKQWHVIDYKTDLFAIEDLTKQIGKHRAQLEGYVGDIRALTGVTVKPQLYFARHGVLTGAD